MSRIIFSIMFVVLFISTGACFAAPLIGKNQPSNPALYGFTQNCENVVSVCWYGIAVNQTRVVEALDMIQGHNYFLASSISTAPSERSQNDTYLPCGIYFIFEFRTVNGIIVKCRDLRLGDWIARFGMPDAIGKHHDVLYYTNGVKMRLVIQGALRPDAHISEFMLPIPRAFKEPHYKWHGFAPQWRYCQLDSADYCT